MGFPIRLASLLAPVLVGVIAGCTPTVGEIRSAERRQAREQAKLSRALAGLTPGEPQACLSGPDRRLARVENIGGTLLFRVANNRIYRNDMNGNCAPNRTDPIFVTQTPSTSLCRGDITQLIDRAARFPVGSCSYGAFVPYSRPE